MLLSLIDQSQYSIRSHDLKANPNEYLGIYQVKMIQKDGLTK